MRLTEDEMIRTVQPRLLREVIRQEAVQPDAHGGISCYRCCHRHCHLLHLSQGGRWGSCNSPVGHPG